MPLAVRLFWEAVAEATPGRRSGARDEEILRRGRERRARRRSVERANGYTDRRPICVVASISSSSSTLWLEGEFRIRFEWRG